MGQVKRGSSPDRSSLKCAVVPDRGVRYYCALRREPLQQDGSTPHVTVDIHVV